MKECLMFDVGILLTWSACLHSQAKRRRANRPKKGAKGESQEGQLQDDQETVTVGTERRTAIMNVLRYCSAEAWTKMVTHSSWCQNQCQSALSDAILSWPYLWPRSKTPVGSFPTEQQELASSSASKPHIHIFVPFSITVFHGNLVF